MKGYNVNVLEIRASSQVQKLLRQKKLPSSIAAKLAEWIKALELVGLADVQRKPSWRDEALKGQRQGQRSIRLNRQWRAIYSVSSSGELTLLTIEEVTPHDYRVR